jgi:hypothetical protein
MSVPVARRLWRAVEPYHAVGYFAPEARAAYEEIGLKGFWMGYFAARSAPLGRASPELVTATFYVFHPSMIERALPDAWQRADPTDVLDARLRLVGRVLERLLGREALSDPQIVGAATLAREAADSGEVAGRPLYAAHRTLAYPEAPHLALWHAATLLREHRGDGHVAALAAAGIDGCEANVLAAASGATTAELLRTSRQWPPDEWGTALDRSIRRGLIRDDGSLAEEGRSVKDSIEARTDSLAERPLAALGAKGCARLLELMGGLSRRLVEAGGVPFPNPIALPDPAKA